MKSKFFEIRDSGTTIPVLAIKTEGETLEERLFFERGGWGGNSVVLISINGGIEATHDPFKWESTRTMKMAHLYIQRYFEGLDNYSVVDVEFINGETTEPKTSEILV